MNNKYKKIISIIVLLIGFSTVARIPFKNELIVLAMAIFGIVLGEIIRKDKYKNFILSIGVILSAFSFVAIILSIIF